MHCVALHDTVLRVINFLARCAASLISAVALFSFGTLGHAAGPTGLLNDTGQIQCNNGGTMVTCDAATTGDASVRPRQDGRFGRDVANPIKVGGGAAGFDFTKVCMDGALNCTAVADTSATPAASNWACTKDNVTNLIWSLHSGGGDWTTYARTTLPAAHNAQNRCGFTAGWRLPTRKELQSIVHYGTNSVSIDLAYFPDTRASYYWTDDPSARLSDFAWVVAFSLGGSLTLGKPLQNFVRLVHNGQ